MPRQSAVVRRRPLPLTRTMPRKITPIGASIETLIEIARPAAIPAMISGPLSSSGALASGVSDTAPDFGARR